MAISEIRTAACCIKPPASLASDDLMAAGERAQRCPAIKDRGQGPSSLRQRSLFTWLDWHSEAAPAIPKPSHEIRADAQASKS